MDFGMFLSWAVVGLLVGWLAGFVMKGGGYGLIGDLVLGLAGGIVGGGIFYALGVSPAGGVLPAILIAFVGAALVIVAQRTFLAHGQPGSVSRP